MLLSKIKAVNGVYEKYKPNTLEEVLANVVLAKNTFGQSINRYTSKYNVIYQLRFYNPYLFETEITDFAYMIFGFTNDVFHRIAYGLDYWFIQSESKDKNAGVSTKNYYQRINFLRNKKRINQQDAETLCNFSRARNFGTHYGKLVFIDYIFCNIHIINNLLEVTIQLLQNTANVNDLEYRRYLNGQLDFINDLENTLNSYIMENNISL